MNRISLLSGIALVAWALSGCIPGAAGTLAGIVLTLDQPVQGSFAPGDRSLREVLRGQGFTDQALDAILPGLGVGGGTFTDAYQFQGTAGQEVAVRVGADVPVFLMLLFSTESASGRDITFVAAGNQEETTTPMIPPIALPMTGAYTIVVNSVKGQPGNYTVTLASS